MCYQTTTLCYRNTQALPEQNSTTGLPSFIEVLQDFMHYWSVLPDQACSLLPDWTSSVLVELACYQSRWSSTGLYWALPNCACATRIHTCYQFSCILAWSCLDILLQHLMNSYIQLYLHNHVSCYRRCLQEFLQHVTTRISCSLYATRVSSINTNHQFPSNTCWLGKYS